MPNTDILDENQLRRIQERPPDFGQHGVVLGVAERDALCQTVRAVWAERLEIQRALASSVLNDPTEDDDPPYSTTELVEGIRGLIKMKESLRTRHVQLKARLAQAERERERIRQTLIGAADTDDLPAYCARVVRRMQEDLETIATLGEFRTRAIELCRDKAAEWGQRIEGVSPEANTNALRGAMVLAANEIREGLETLT